MGKAIATILTRIRVAWIAWWRNLLLTILTGKVFRAHAEA
jgi:hypothetical protein